jgi:hypothetical protein
VKLRPVVLLNCRTSERESEPGVLPEGASLATSTVEFRQMSVLSEIIERAGDAWQPGARHILQKPCMER